MFLLADDHVMLLWIFIRWRALLLVRQLTWLFVCQVMKQLMNIPVEFWVRFVNLDEEFDDVDDQQSNMPADSHG